MTYIPIPNSQI